MHISALSTIPSPLKSGDGELSPVSHSYIVETAGHGWILSVPPIAYILPFTTLVEKQDLRSGISDSLIQISIAGSYTSTIE
jgi:hypothetical protein